MFYQIEGRRNPDSPLEIAVVTHEFWMEKAEALARQWHQVRIAMVQDYIGVKGAICPGYPTDAPA